MFENTIKHISNYITSHIQKDRLESSKHSLGRQSEVNAWYLECIHALKK